MIKHWNLFFLCCLTWQLSAKDFLVTDFGARPTEGTINTISINKAISVCHNAGGGRVVIPPGIFMSGTLLLQNKVELHLEKAGDPKCRLIERLKYYSISPFSLNTACSSPVI